jgi:hypothetical protein
MTRSQKNFQTAGCSIGVCADAVGQTVVNRRDLNVGFQNAEAALDTP